jgi:hypothetical protein
MAVSTAEALTPPGASNKLSSAKARPAETAMEIELSDEQRKALFELLNDTLPTLRQEVYRTENFEFREQLKRKEQIIKELLDKISVSA